jgi:homeobox protein ESX1
MKCMNDVEQAGVAPRRAQVPISPNDPQPPVPPGPPGAPPGPDLPDVPIEDPPGPDQPIPDEPGVPPAGDPPTTPPVRMMPKEIGGPSGPEPTRYGDWERKGRVSDF